MPLTRDFKVTVRERLQRDPGFREALLTEAVDCLLSSDVETGKSLLRDYVNATIGFGELGGLTDKSPKSLMRMLSSTGNPHARNLFEIIDCLQTRMPTLNWRTREDDIRVGTWAGPCPCRLET